MKISEETYKKLNKLAVAMHDSEGRELPNPVPHTIPTGLSRPLTLQEQIQRIIKTNLSIEAQRAGLESFEESLDFDVKDPFEVDFSNFEGYTLMEDDYPIPDHKIDEENQEVTEEETQTPENIEENGEATPPAA